MRCGVNDYIIKDREGGFMQLLPEVTRRVHTAHCEQAQRIRAERQLNLADQAMAAVESGITISNSRAGDEIIYCNQAFSDLTGYSEAEVLGRNCRFLQGVDTDPETVRQIHLAIAQGRSFRGVIRNYCKGGTAFWNDLTISPLHGVDGELTHFVGIQNDITARIERDAALRESELRFRQLAENICEVFWVTNVETHAVLYVSPAYEVIWARTCQSVYDNPNSWMDAIHPDDQAKVGQAYFGAVADGVEYEEEFRIVRPDGAIRWIRDRGSPVLDDNGKPWRIAGIAEDITERKRDSDRQLESLQEKETLLREVHHRVKNNLQIVSSLLHFQARKLKDPEALEIISDGRRRLQAMILVHEQLYGANHFGRIEFGDYLRRLAGEMASSHEGGAIELDVELADGSVFLPIEVALPVGMIVNELVTNALKHAYPDGGRGKIGICLQRSSPGLKIQVVDDGRGMSASVDLDQPKSFGLQLVNNLAAQVGGAISFQSDGGTAATLVLESEELIPLEN